MADHGTGHVLPENLELVNQLQRQENLPCTDTFSANVPRWLHVTVVIKEAKEAELANFDRFDVYDEASDVSQTRLGTHWVVSEKVQEEKVITKARLTIWGDLEDSSLFAKDSPTVRKGNIRILLAVAAKNDWLIKSSDVTSAFLQSAPIECNVTLQPPKELRFPGILGQLRWPVYGLCDASLTSIAEYLQIKQTCNAAYSPNANGCNERNHAVVDRMII